MIVKRRVKKAAMMLLSDFSSFFISFCSSFCTISLGHLNERTCMAPWACDEIRNARAPNPSKTEHKLRACPQRRETCLQRRLRANDLYHAALSILIQNGYQHLRTGGLIQRTETAHEFCGGELGHAALQI